MGKQRMLDSTNTHLPEPHVKGSKMSIRGDYLKNAYIFHTLKSMWKV